MAEQKCDVAACGLVTAGSIKNDGLHRNEQDFVFVIKNSLLFYLSNAVTFCKHHN